MLQKLKASLVYTYIGNIKKMLKPLDYFSENILMVHHKVFSSEDASEAHVCHGIENLNSTSTVMLLFI